MESTITIPLDRYNSLLKKEAILDMVLQGAVVNYSYERDALVNAARKIFEEGLLEC